MQPKKENKQIPKEMKRIKEVITIPDDDGKWRGEGFRWGNNTTNIGRKVG